MALAASAAIKNISDFTLKALAHGCTSEPPCVVTLGAKTLDCNLKQSQIVDWQNEPS